MQKLYSYGLSTALLLGVFGAQAQNKPAGPAFALGTSQALVQQLENQVNKAATTRGKSTVTLRVSEAQAFTGQVNFRDALSKTGEYLNGEIPGLPGSSFMVRVEGQTVEGNIILPATKQAYRYSADARGNAFVQEVDINKVVCIDYNKPVGYRDVAPATGTGNKTAVVSLQSFPGARGCILLDFDGYSMPAGKGWNNGNAYNAASSGIENDNAKVQAFWELVSEDYRPFSMNVTTDENVFNSYPTNMRIRCVVSPGSGSTIAPGAGGVAYIGSFRDTNDVPCWVFMNDPKSGGEASSHEVGHTLGLGHDGRVNPAEGYYTGQDNSGAWAPIMGAGYYKPVTHWSKGEYNRASNTEDDLSIMASATYNVGYRNDDHSGSISGATSLARNGNSVSGNGIIERTSDQDYFAFTTGGGTVSLNVNTVSRYGNLDIVARLFNGSGTQIGTFDTGGGGNLNVSFSASLGAGTYYLQIDGTSSGNPATDGYSDYGSLGLFSISGTVPAASSGVATLYKDCNYTGTAVSLPVGDYNLSAMQARGILDDDISSLTVNGGYEVVLYENDNFTGTALTITGGNSCLVGNALGAGNWNDKVTSLRVRTASAAFSQLLEAEAASVNSGMTAEACTEGGQNLGYVDAADYLVFNGINFPTSGTYTIEYRVASPSGGTVSSDLNAGTTLLGNTTIPATGGWQNWTTVSKSVSINAGTYNFGVYAQTGGWNINWVRITKTSAREAATAASDIAKVETRLELYPNPVTDRLTLTSAADFRGQRVSIMSMEGLEVWHGTFSGETVDVSTLKPGLYTLVVITKDRQKLVSRFSKQ